MRVAAQYESDRDRINECYLFVCEKLSDNGFRRLLQYQPGSTARFRTWLNVVIANLCIDWGRAQRGRPRPFTSIGALPGLEQAVFRCRFQQGLNFNACLAALQPDFPDLDESRLHRAVQRVSAALTPRQHFLLSVNRGGTVSLDDSETQMAIGQVPDQQVGPEAHAASIEARERLQLALGKLGARHRLLLELRYEQELSLKEIARLLRLGDPFRARREVQSALAELERLFKT